jgi:hypothetical protein
MKGAWLLLGYLAGIVLGISMMDMISVNTVTSFQKFGQTISGFIGLVIVIWGIACLGNLLLAKPHEQFDWHK